MLIVFLIAASLVTQDNGNVNESVNVSKPFIYRGIRLIINIDELMITFPNLLEYIFKHV